MKVAFGKIKITPNEFIDQPLAGYSRPDPCLGKLDDIHAYGVLIENITLKNVKKHLLLISLDLLKIPIMVADYIKEKIKDHFFSLGPGHILIHATHTHSAPDITGEFHWPGSALNVVRGIMFGANRNDKYIVWVTKQVLKLVGILFQNLHPCKIAWKKEEFNPDIVINRRHPLRDVKTNLGVICFKSINNNKLLGFIINYACHPTTLSYINNKISADYPGRIIAKIDEISGGKVKSVFFNGPAGDLNPITTCGTNYEKLDKERTPIYQQFGTYKHTKKIGYTIAKKAFSLAKSIEDSEYYEQLEFQSYLKTIWIPMDDVEYFSSTWFVNKLIFLLKKYLVLPAAMCHEKDPNFPALAIKGSGSQINGYTVLQCIQITAKSQDKIKDLSIIAVPGELFEEIGDLFLKSSPTHKKNTFIFQNSNDWIAYLFPKDEYINQGGYEPIASFGPLCGEYVKKEMLLLFKEINNKLTLGHY
ncbi:MAG: hypothetical protein R6U96_10735 [Promethearchaeia archaeon]